MRRRMAGTIVVLAAAFALTTPANADAAVLARQYSYGLHSAQLDGGAVFWRNRTDFYDRSISVSPRILRRDLGGAAPEVIYDPGPDDQITAFNAANGRVVVGTYNDHDGSSRITEITRTSGGLSTTVLAQRSGNYSGLTCASRVRLIAINAQSEALIEELRVMSRDGNCAPRTLKRNESTTTAIAPDGSSRVLLERKAGWSTSASDDRLGRFVWGSGDWFALSTGSGDYNAFHGSSGMLNLATGQFAEAQVPSDSWGDFEVSRTGRVLANHYGFETVLRSDPLFPDRYRTLTRAHATRWMHFCGDKILEISRRGEPWGTRRSLRRKNTAGSHWNLYILNADGIRERRLPQRLKRGTNFGTCDADTAVFHKYLKGFRARQFTVSLRPPTA